MSTPRSRLRELLASDETLIVPGAYDALSARLIEAAGFDALYIGSYATAASRLGLPDVGVLSLDELVAQAKTVVDAVQLPVIADAENGFHDAANIWRTVRAFEGAGVSAIHIEDHAFGKHADVPQRVLPLEQILARLRAALEARSDPDFVIIARTDVAWALGDVDEAIRRANAFTDIGADLVFFSGFSASQLAQHRSRIKGRVVLVDTRGASTAEERAAGAAMVLSYGNTLFAAYRGVQAMLAGLRSTGKAVDASGDAAEFERFIGYAEFAERAKRYGEA